MEIIECDFTGLDFTFSVGNEMSHLISKTISALKLQIKNSKMKWTEILTETHSFYSVLSLSVENCLFENCIIEKIVEDGFFGAVIENINFVGVYNGIFIGQAFFLIIKNCSLRTIEGSCVFGCAIYFKGVHEIEKKMSIQKDLALLLSCICLDYDISNPELAIENTVFTGGVKTAGSVIFCDGANLKMTNSSINMTQIGEGGYLHFSTAFRKFSLTIRNSKYYINDFTRETNIMSLTASTIDANNVTISFSKEFRVTEKERYPTKLFKYEFGCSKNFYTFETGNKILEGSYEDWQVGNLSKSADDVKCFPCPVGGICDKNLNSLPNYWGYKDKSETVTMIRCPEDYCCKDYEECIGIQSCNSGRSGDLCATCKDNFTESLYSPVCVPADECQNDLFWILYLLTVVSYATTLIMGRWFKDRSLVIFKKMYLLLRTKCLSTCCRADKDHQFDIQHESVEPEHGPIDTVSSNDSERETSQTETDMTRLERKSDKSHNGGFKYIQQLFYYVQDASLFKVYLPLESSNNLGTVVRILSFSPEILTVYIKLINLCWIYFSTPVKKIVLKSVFGYFVMMFIFLVFVVQKVLSAFLKKNSSVWKHVQVSLVQGLILCVLFSFQQLLRVPFL